MKLKTGGLVGNLCKKPQTLRSPPPRKATAVPLVDRRLETLERTEQGSLHSWAPGTVKA